MHKVFPASQYDAIDVAIVVARRTTADVVARAILVNIAGVMLRLRQQVSKRLITRIFDRYWF